MNLICNDDNELFPNDQRYKQYCQSIDRALKQFESSKDWIDLIPKLTTLKRTIESNGEFRSIPKRLIVTKLLAQCLHHKLPSGIHLKTLEVYETIFKTIDRNQLKRDLLLYTYGLFPLLSVAALNVKPVLLSLYETYFLPLGRCLEAILSGFLIGLFSSLEEGVDYYPRVTNLLDRLTQEVDEFEFYASFWSAIFLVSSVRHPALLFIRSHFDQKRFFKGSSEETMISAICVCLDENEQSVVQRSIFDFLLLYSPMNDKQFDSSRMANLLEKTFDLLLKRDSSLNRRIYQWFLGDTSDFFLTHTRDLLVESIRQALNKVSVEPTKINKLIRILLILIDKPDVGPEIIELIFMDYLLLIHKSLDHFKRQSSLSDVQLELNSMEFFKTFQLLLDTLEPSFIFDFFIKQFQLLLTTEVNFTLEDLSAIVEILLETSFIDFDDKIRSIYLPTMLSRFVELLDEHLEKFSPERMSLMMKFFVRIQQKIRSTDGDQIDQLLSHMIDRLNLSRFFHHFIVRFLIDGDPEEQFQRMSSHLEEAVEDYTSIFLSEDFELTLHRHADRYVDAFEDCCRFFRDSLLGTTIDFDQCFTDLCVLSFCQTEHFHLQTIGITLLIELIDFARESYSILPREISFLLNERQFFQYLIAHLWTEFDRCPMKSSQLLLKLNSLLFDEMCDRQICRFLTSNSTDQYKQFFQFWHWTRRLTTSINVKPFAHSFLALLSHIRTSTHYNIQSIVDQWICDCFLQGDTSRMLDILLSILLHRDTIRTNVQQIDQKIYEELFRHPEIEAVEKDQLEFDDDYVREYQLDSDHDENDERTSSMNNDTDSTRSSPQLIKLPSLLNFPQPILFGLRSLSPTTSAKSSKQRPSRKSSRSLGSRPHSLTIPNYLNETDSFAIDYHHIHILFYTQSYSINEILRALNIIEHLIDLLPEQLIGQLFRLKIDPSSSMWKLFSYHQQSIGNDHRIDYLYLLIEVLLIYIRSYPSTTIDVENHRQIHLRCYILLRRICHDLSSLCLDQVLSTDEIHHLLRKLNFQKILFHLFQRILSNRTIHYASDSFSKEFLDLFEEMIFLEYFLSSSNADLFHQSIVNQTLFLLMVLQYLRNLQCMENHRYLINFIRRILPLCGSTLKTISIDVIDQLDRNLYLVVFHSDQQRLKEIDLCDYVVHSIESLAYICHFCLENHFNPVQYLSQTPCPQRWIQRIRTISPDLHRVRPSIFAKLPSIISNLLFVWTHVASWSDENVQRIHQSIRNFFSSLLKLNGVQILRAMAYCWGGRQRSSTATSRDHSKEMNTLIEILIHLHDYTITELISTMSEFIRNQSTNDEKKKENYTMWCFQFLLAYCERQTKFSIDCWSSLANMFNECLTQSISPTVTFLMIRIWSFYIKQAISFIEKRDLKDVQDITMKLLENCNTIVASSLIQSKWLRKNLQVQLTASGSFPVTNDTSTESIDEIPVKIDVTCQSITSSSMALSILAEHVSTLLNVIYNITDEKDRVLLPYLKNLVTNLMPFIRAQHSSALSASNVLMTISQFPYTRPAWKKEVFDYFFDQHFFQMDLASLRAWKSLLYNFLSNEKSSFTEILPRINFTSTGLFQPKDNECEQRAMLMKRLAFILFASEKDQWNRHVSDLLERLTELLKIPTTPILQTQIFLFCRVLLLRISNKNLLAFWPIIMTELVQIFLLLEQDLRTCTSEDVNASSNVQGVGNSDSLKMYLFACKLLDVLLTIPSADFSYFQFSRHAFVADAHPRRLLDLFEDKLRSMPTSVPKMTNTSDRPLLRQHAISNLIELYPFLLSLSTMQYYHPIEEFSSEKSTIMNTIESNILEDFLE